MRRSFPRSCRAFLFLIVCLVPSRGWAEGVLRPDRSQPTAQSEQRLSLTTPEGVQLEGVIVRPVFEQAAQPALPPVVILIHEFGRDSDSLRPLTDALAQAGMAVALFDQRGHGSSRIRRVGNREYIYSFPVIPSEEFAFAVDDLRLLLESLESAEGLDAKRLAIVGIREGALVAAQAAGRYPEIDALVLLDTVISSKGLDAAQGLSRYGGRPALLLHSAFPSSMEIAVALAEYGAGERAVHGIEKYESGHLLLVEDTDAMTRIATWLQERFGLAAAETSPKATLR